MGIKTYIRKHPKFMSICACIYNLAGMNRYKNLSGLKRNIRASFLRNVKCENHGCDNRLIIDEGCRVRNATFIFWGNGNTIHIEHDCVLAGTSFWVSDGSNIHVGNHTWFNGTTELAATERRTITLGERCLFADEIVVRTGDSHSIILEESQERINPAEDVVVGDHVWICQRAIILKGSVVGNDSVVGANTLIGRGTYPANSLLVGIPAKVVKQEINWDSALR